MLLCGVLLRTDYAPAYHAGHYARVTESVDVAGLKPAAARRTGSSPVPRTTPPTTRLIWLKPVARARGGAPDEIDVVVLEV